MATKAQMVLIGARLLQSAMARWPVGRFAASSPGRRGEEDCTRASKEGATVYHWVLWLTVSAPRARECGTGSEWLTGVAMPGERVGQRAGALLSL